jgi:hypothetical protein
VVLHHRAHERVPFRLIGYIENTQATAGTWATGPSVIQPMGPGVRKPGEVIQTALTLTGTALTGSVTIPADDTPPQSGEGDQYMSQAITPTSSINALEVDALAFLANSAAGGTGVTVALFQDLATTALVAAVKTSAGVGYVNDFKMSFVTRASTTSSTTFKVRAGSSAAGTLTFNGAAGARLMGGVMCSSLQVVERMA